MSIKLGTRGKMCDHPLLFALSILDYSLTGSETGFTQCLTWLIYVGIQLLTPMKKKSNCTLMLSYKVCLVPNKYTSLFSAKLFNFDFFIPFRHDWEILTNGFSDHTCAPNQFKMPNNAPWRDLPNIRHQAHCSWQSLYPDTKATLCDQPPEVKAHDLTGCSLLYCDHCECVGGEVGAVQSAHLLFVCVLKYLVLKVKCHCGAAEFQRSDEEQRASDRQRIDGVDMFTVGDTVSRQPACPQCINAWPLHCQLTTPVHLVPCLISMFALLNHSQRNTKIRGWYKI